MESSHTYLVPTLCVGMPFGGFASCDVRTCSRVRRIRDAKRPRCIPTRSVGTRLMKDIQDFFIV
ncbi:hypothetical protein [Desulfonema magnum]|uniref:Uncharacterized protein n=1 Tax=Desulfonema magnum TaxID=45655 RepID=A0A975GLK5_9BACT|nr:hypothetical protein [Desulfonema magnum]QTA85946.1 Uncharacterized protein dnm_019630 [Desulfonema magnum]